ncbi:DUF5958 family protein [Streptomyces sp. NPDC059171]|uniref:DUF5958 family protein n=1 Tax=Streptomyces sp. NPDC059171 TaxID=3346755 RepID=UPI003696B2A5
MTLYELAQELRPMSQGIEWFESLSAEEQSNTLRFLSHFCIQARATAEDAPESIRRAGLRATHTPSPFQLHVELQGRHSSRGWHCRGCNGLRRDR